MSRVVEILSFLALAAFVMPFAPGEISHRGLVGKAVWAVFALAGGFGIMGIVFALLPGGIPWSWLAFAMVVAFVVVHIVLCSDLFARAGAGDVEEASAATR